ncbi:MAG TPA: DNA repair helicase XPB [Spirochaetia bacterium]|nr:DNA repair helicase XPB [Spirochaetia bacterium]
MNYNPQNPLIVQSDRTVLLEVHNPLYEAARDRLSAFAELEKSPEHIHTYRISPLSLWNAAASGVKARDIRDALNDYGKFPLPANVARDIQDYIERYGLVKLVEREGRLFLTSVDPAALAEIRHHKEAGTFITGRAPDGSLELAPCHRGLAKQVLIKAGYPVEDLAGYVEGARLDFSLRPVTSAGQPFGLRDYQQAAADVFHAGGSARGGSGVLVLPCGAGKTVIGLGVMSLLQCQTLILTTNIIAARQWISELCEKTDLPREAVGEYSGETKSIKPVTVATYQILTSRKSKTGEFKHFALFNSMDWGLIIYDEVHLLPAPVFRITSELQARRRMGLTATLVREDGKEDDVFTLIGPKKYDIPWKVLEHKGWIAEAMCTEVRLPLAAGLKMEYAVAEMKDKFRIASENSAKMAIIRQLVAKHSQDQVLVIGQYIRQLEEVAEKLGAPLITGKVGNLDREKLYESFKKGEIKVLVVSKVANFAVDLPDANVAIQISGTFGSRQEEAQRLGRILRPKGSGGGAYFYSLVSKDTREQEFALNRQLFLTEQGYRYLIVTPEELGKPLPSCAGTPDPDGVIPDNLAVSMDDVRSQAMEKTGTTDRKAGAASHLRLVVNRK